MTATSEVQKRRAQIRKMAGKVPAKRMAAKLGCSVAVVHNDASLMGISLKTNEVSKRQKAKDEKQTKESNAKLEKLAKLAETMTLKQIAEEMAMLPSSVSRLAKAYGIEVMKVAPGPTPVQRDTLERKLDAASRLLREHGWMVRRPDPFLDKAMSL